MIEQHTPSDNFADDPERVVTTAPLFDDPKTPALRPQELDDFIGQATIKKNLGIFIQAAKQRQEPIEHVLLHGPPGLGKTTLATIVANEMSVNIKTTSGPAIERAGDLAAILTNLQHGDVLFIDEIHRMQRVVEEVLYPAMEDRQLDIIIGKGPAARSIRLDLQPFTLIGATTRVGLLSAPLRDRFGILERLEFYTHEDLATIIRRAATVLDTDISEDSAYQLARRSRGTPRIANRLLKRVRDWAQVHNNATISPDLVADACESLAIDALGLDKIDRQYLRIIIEHFNGGPVGIDTIAASLSEDVGTLEDVYEPYLLQIGFIDRTARGRMARPEAYKHLGLTPPEVMVQTKFV